MEAKIKKLIENLLEKTKKRETKYDRIGNGERFILILESGNVLIEKFLSTKGNRVYQFSILNLKGDIILNVQEIKDQGFPLSEGYILLRNLHEEIKKAYFKVDETIDGLLGELSKEGEVGKEDPNKLPF